jgi:hypothetical protein
MNITEEGKDMAKMIVHKKNHDEQTRGNVALKGEELRDTTANGRRLDFWDQPIKANR